MLKTIYKRVMWLARETSMVLGLAVMLAVVLGIASVAFAATGGNFILGKTNKANQVSKLQRTTFGPALELLVSHGAAPLIVNSNTKVDNLNADLLDGQESSQIGRELYAVIGSDGSFVRHNGMTGIAKPNTGKYAVRFNRDVSGCAYTATTTNGQAGLTGVDEGSDQGGTADQVFVFTNASNGAAADLPFHLIVTC